MIMPVYFVVMIMGIASMQTGVVAPKLILSTPIINSLLVLKDIFMQGARPGAGIFSSAIQRFLKWNDKTGIIQILRKVCGVLVILGGLFILYR